MRECRARDCIAALIFRCALVVLPLLAGCSTGTPKNLHTPDHLIVGTVRFRKPAPIIDEDDLKGARAADQKQDGNFDCMKVEEFFARIDRHELRQCLNGLTQTIDVSYRLRRRDFPWLELDEEKDTPACLTALLKKLPIPREIVFESLSPGGRECYTSRIDVMADDYFGIRLPVGKVALRLHFPLKHTFADDAELTRQMAAWVLSLFYRADEGVFPAKIFPRSYCDRCLGARAPETANDPKPVLWPSVPYPKNPAEFQRDVQASP